MLATEHYPSGPRINREVDKRSRSSIARALQGGAQARGELEEACRTQSVSQFGVSLPGIIMYWL